MMKRLARFLLATIVASMFLPPAARAATPPLRVWVSPQVFSPDGDGYRDYGRLVYQLSRRTRVYLYVYQGNTLIRRILVGRVQSAGRHQAYWNGRNAAGAPVPNGYYRYRIATTMTYRGRRISTYRWVKVARKPPPVQTRWIGFYVTGAPWDMNPVLGLESEVGTRVAVVNCFQSINDGFNADTLGRVSDHGSVPMVSMEFWRPAGGADQPEYRLKKIAAGDFDAKLAAFADKARVFGRTIWLRPLHEMNGNWYPWCGTANGNAPADFVPAWRRIRGIFTSRGAANVRFVWCPNAESVPNLSSNSIESYWPGDAYVDYIALDGYNFGTSASWSSWRSFSEVFGPAYSTVTGLTTKPLFIAETACAPMGGDKAAWIADMFLDVPARFPRITGICWFNENHYPDWRVESSAGSLSAFRQGLAAF
ncbi:MAG: hypothetical protein C4521_09125 [Actinobacteria bacterium]|nr:MAG: hypothetical protein C4521_09125 [Actinomycetota bacterium]